MIKHKQTCWPLIFLTAKKASFLIAITRQLNIFSRWPWGAENLYLNFCEIVFVTGAVTCFEWNSSGVYGKYLKTGAVLCSKCDHWPLVWQDRRFEECPCVGNNERLLQVEGQLKSILAIVAVVLPPSAFLLGIKHPLCNVLCGVFSLVAMKPFCDFLCGKKTRAKKQQLFVDKHRCGIIGITISNISLGRGSLFLGVFVRSMWTFSELVHHDMCVVVHSFGQWRMWLCHAATVRS